MRVANAQQKYLNEVFGLEDDRELLKIRERMIAAEKEYLSISGFEARLLQFFLRFSGARRVVEFGTAFGYSAVAMAKVLPPDGVVITLEKDPSMHSEAELTFAQSTSSSKIVSLCGDAEELMESIVARGPFDFAFIDANKSGYCTYLDWAERNVRTGGFIAGDNSFLWGALWDQPQRESIGPGQVRVMTEFNRRLADPSRYNSTLIPTVEGLTIAQKLF